MKSKINICYLCGQKLNIDIDDDHVPPRQLYAREIRKIHSPNLFTLPVHKKCHKPYQKDEDYFVHSLAPACQGSYTGNAIWKDISNQFKRPQGKRIGKMIFKEFTQRPSGIILPFGKIAKRFNGQRIRRIAWKIIRGLFFKEKNQVLPENKPRYIKVIAPDERPPDEFVYVRDTPSRGQYPAVFDYKYINISELNNFNFWAMLFWDRLITLIAFHDPSCSCEICEN